MPNQTIISGPYGTFNLNAGPDYAEVYQLQLQAQNEQQAAQSAAQTYAAQINEQTQIYNTIQNQANTFRGLEQNPQNTSRANITQSRANQQAQLIQNLRTTAQNDLTSRQTKIAQLQQRAEETRNQIDTNYKAAIEDYNASAQEFNQQELKKYYSQFGPFEKTTTKNIPSVINPDYNGPLYGESKSPALPYKFEKITPEYTPSIITPGTTVYKTMSPDGKTQYSTVEPIQLTQETPAAQSPEQKTFTITNALNLIGQRTVEGFNQVNELIPTFISGLSTQNTLLPATPRVPKNIVQIAVVPGSILSGALGAIGGTAESLEIIANQSLGRPATSFEIDVPFIQSPTGEKISIKPIPTIAQIIGTGGINKVASEFKAGQFEAAPKKIAVSQEIPATEFQGYGRDIGPTTIQTITTPKTFLQKFALGEKPYITETKIEPDFTSTAGYSVDELTKNAISQIKGTTQQIYPIETPPTKFSAVSTFTQETLFRDIRFEPSNQELTIIQNAPGSTDLTPIIAKTNPAKLIETNITTQYGSISGEIGGKPFSKEFYYPESSQIIKPIYDELIQTPDQITLEPNKGYLFETRGVKTDNLKSEISYKLKGANPSVPKIIEPLPQSGYLVPADASPAELIKNYFEKPVSARATSDIQEILKSERGSIAITKPQFKIEYYDEIQKLANIQKTPRIDTPFAGQISKITEANFAKSLTKDFSAIISPATKKNATAKTITQQTTTTSTAPPIQDNTLGSFDQTQNQTKLTTQIKNPLLAKIDKTITQPISFPLTERIDIPPITAPPIAPRLTQTPKNPFKIYPPIPSGSETPNQNRAAGGSTTQIGRQGYDVYVNQGKKFVRINRQGISLDKNEAKKYGQLVADNTTGQTVKIRTSKDPIGKLEQNLPELSKKFTQKKDKTGLTYIEKTQFKKDTKGEKLGLTPTKYLFNNLKNIKIPTQKSKFK